MKLKNNIMTFSKSALLLLACTIGTINARIGNIKTSNRNDKKDGKHRNNLLPHSVDGMVVRYYDELFLCLCEAC